MVTTALTTSQPRKIKLNVCTENVHLDTISRMALSEWCAVITLLFRHSEYSECSTINIHSKKILKIRLIRHVSRLLLQRRISTLNDMRCHADHSAATVGSGVNRSSQAGAGRPVVCAQSCGALPGSPKLSARSSSVPWCGGGHQPFSGDYNDQGA